MSRTTISAGTATGNVEQLVDAHVTESVLRCWVREHGIPVPSDVLTLTAGASRVSVPVHAASPTGWHRLGTPHLDGRPLHTADLVTVLADALVQRDRLPGERGDDLVQRTCGSRERILAHAQARRDDDAELPPGFLAGEQGLIAGHPFHPAAKSREDLHGPDLVASSPELQGRLALHWLAVDRRLVAGGSALPRGIEQVLGDLPHRPPAPEGTVALPAHPWQARTLLARPAVADLVEQGAVRDLGAHGDPWYPTSSLRTLWHPSAPWMLKLSLAARITNSRRENRRAELRLGEQAHRLLAAGVGQALAAAHPGFEVLTDPAWAGVDVAGGGFELALRTNPLSATAPVVCVAARVDERPGCGGPVLAELLRRRAHATHRHVADLADDWLRSYLDRVVAPLAWLDATWGIVLEAHHQNTLVRLDRHGWPAGGWYRDSQGWYVARSAIGAVRSLVPDFGAGVDAVFDDDLVARRGAYYVGVNNVFGVIGALGAAGIAPEDRLLGTTRAVLGRLPRSRVLDVLLHEARIPCKANLLTCADGRDELDGTVEQQSVYVDVANPLLEVRA
ncbi:MAG: IucA/IucC family protein [Acidimicrobiia bacterium]